MEKTNSARLWIWGMLIQNIIFLLFFNLKLILPGNEPAAKVIGWQLLYTFVVWEATRLTVRLSWSLYPGIARIRRRLLCMAAVLLVVSVSTGCWHAWMEHWLGFRELNEMNNIFSYLYSIGITLFFCQLVAGVYEAGNYLEQWRRMVKEAEEPELKNQTS